MRINKFVALSSGLSRRAADQAIQTGRVTINNLTASLGQEVAETDSVTLDSVSIQLPEAAITIMLNKPVGYVVSRDGQGSRTIYDLLPPALHKLKPVGRLDKDSSGLLLVTNDGQLAQELTHPKYAKEKVYKVHLDKPLATVDLAHLKQGVQLEDGMSHLGIQQLSGSKLVPNSYLLVSMSEGRNRQIRRTFTALSYMVIKLHRIKFGQYDLGTVASGQYRSLSTG